MPKLEYAYFYLASDTANNAVDSRKLYPEIEHPDGITAKCSSIHVNNVNNNHITMEICFDRPLRLKEIGRLDAIIAAHNG